MVSRRDKDRDRLIDVAAHVKRLREELAVAEADLDRLLRAESGQDDDDEEGTLAQRILTLLDGTPVRVFSPDAVAKELDVQELRSVRSTLSRLHLQALIARPERGVYQSRLYPRVSTSDSNLNRLTGAAAAAGYAAGQAARRRAEAASASEASEESDPFADK